MENKFFNKALDLSKAFGFLTFKEVNVIQIICSEYLNKDSVVINIGAGSGTSGLAMVEAQPEMKVITIDVSQESPFGGMQNETNAFNVHGKGLRTPYHFLSDSADSVKTIDEFLKDNGIKPRKFFDLIMVDAGHLYHEIKRDTEAWYKKVAPGGFIVFHDYNRNVWPAVAEYINNEFRLNKEFSEFIKADTIIVFRKNK